MIRYLNLKKSIYLGLRAVRASGWGELKELFDNYDPKMDKVVELVSQWTVASKRRGAMESFLKHKQAKEQTRLGQMNMQSWAAEAGGKSRPASQKAAAP